MKMNHKHWRPLLATALVAGLTACGGGSSGGGGGDPTPTDTTPDTFSFTPKVDVLLNAIVESNAITVGGINAAASVAIAGGEYSINGGAYTGAAGTVTQGQTVQVRLTSADALGATEVATLTIGDVDGKFSVTTRADNTAPQAAVLFPTPSSFTTGDTILMRGTAADGQGSEITSVSVNGVQASSDDGFATWRASVPLAFGENTLTVETQDRLNTDSAAASVAVTSRTDPEFTLPAKAVLDSAGNRALVTDEESGSLFSVALDSGVRSILSGADPNHQGEQIGDGPAFEAPYAVVLDIANNRALVTDVGSNTLFSVDLSTGNRVLLSGTNSDSGELVGAGPALERPWGAALDAGNNRLLIVDGGYLGGEGDPDEVPYAAIVAVDLLTGNREILVDENSDCGESGCGVDMVSVNSVTFDGANNRLLVVESYDAALIAVDLASGRREVLSGSDSVEGDEVGEGEFFSSPVGVALDLDNHRVFVADSGGIGFGAIFSVDLDSGDRQVLSGGFRPDDMDGSGPLFLSPNDIELDSDNNRLLVSDREVGLLFVDLIDGGRQLINQRIGSGPDYEALAKLDFDATSNRILATEGRGEIFAVDTGTGERTVLSGVEVGTGPEFSVITSSVLDGANDRLLIGVRLQDQSRQPSGRLAEGAIYTVDLATGNRVLLSGGSLGAGPAFSLPKAISPPDSASNRILVADAQAKAIFSVDPDTGDRTIISGGMVEGDNVPIGSGPELNDFGSMAWDAKSDRILTLNKEYMESGSFIYTLIAVDVETGDRTELSASWPELVGNFTAVEIDSVNNRMLVLNSHGQRNRGSVFAVDLETGGRSVISGIDPETGSLVGGGPLLDYPTMVAVNAEKNLLYVNHAGDAVMAVDLETGERSLISDGPRLNSGFTIVETKTLAK